MRYRVRVEIEYLIALGEIGLPEPPAFSAAQQQTLRSWYKGFSAEDAASIKEEERAINHDVKAVEYYLKKRLIGELDMPEAKAEFVHFGLTSQDINNTAIPLMLRDAMDALYLPGLMRVLTALEHKAAAWRNLPMLARTHGQPASPTVLGKEMFVFVERLLRMREHLLRCEVPAKFGGATGNLNAHYAAYPHHNWDAFATHFVEEVLGGLTRSRTTTQIEHYDGLAAIFDAVRRLNVILLDLARDCWQYISQGYFVQAVKAHEVGSSAMPHKVNPIDFENAEGNLGLANALFDHLSNKLPISRLQRDLTDSTVLRNVGVPLGHTLLALQSLERGLERISANEPKLEADLSANWAVLAEAIQTILRREGYPKPYEALKALTRTSDAIDSSDLQAFVATLQVSEAVKAELRALTPSTYTGNASV